MTMTAIGREKRVPERKEEKKESHREEDNEAEERRAKRSCRRDNEIAERRGEWNCRKMKQVAEKSGEGSYRERRAVLHREEDNRVAEKKSSRWKRRHTLHRRVEKRREMEIQKMKAERSRESKLIRTKDRILLTIAEHSVSVVLLTETLPCFVSDEDLSLRQSLHF